MQRAHRLVRRLVGRAGAPSRKAAATAAAAGFAEPAGQHRLAPVGRQRCRPPPRAASRLSATAVGQFMTRIASESGSLEQRLQRAGVAARRARRRGCRPGLARDQVGGSSASSRRDRVGRERRRARRHALRARRWRARRRRRHWSGWRGGSPSGRSPADKRRRPPRTARAGDRRAACPARRKAAS